MTIYLTLDHTVELLNVLVGEKPEDYRYENPTGSRSCRYLHTDENLTVKGGCIVGSLLIRAGIHPDHLRPYEGGTADHLVRGLRESGLLDYEYGVDILLRDVQFVQDEYTFVGFTTEEFTREHTWAEAVAHGVAELEARLPKPVSTELYGERKILNHLVASLEGKLTVGV